MVNSATGEAASASSQAVFCSGRATGSRWPRPHRSAQWPRAWVGHHAPVQRLASGPQRPLAPPAAPSSRDRAMHSELVTTMSTNDHDHWPPFFRPQQRGQQRTPMKPVLGNAATSAPKGRVVPADALARASWPRQRPPSPAHTAGTRQTPRHPAIARWAWSSRSGTACTAAQNQHKAVEPANRIQRQQAATGRDKTAAHQGKNGKGDPQNVQHAAIVSGIAGPNRHRAQ